MMDFDNYLYLHKYICTPEYSSVLWYRSVINQWIDHSLVSFALLKRHLVVIIVHNSCTVWMRFNLFIILKKIHSGVSHALSNCISRISNYSNNNNQVVCVILNRQLATSVELLQKWHTLLYKVIKWHESKKNIVLYLMSCSNSSVLVIISGGF